MDIQIFILAVLSAILATLLGTFSLTVTRRYPKQYTRKQKRPLFAQNSDDQARQAINGRREFIAMRLAEMSDPDPARREILETPSGWKEASPRELSENEALAQVAILRWQLERPEYLLLGRLADAVTLIAREFGMTSGELASSVRIQICESPDTYSFTGVIETEEIDLITERLGPIKDWFGLSVFLEPRSQIAPNKCSAIGGRQGNAGGALCELDQPSYLVTCSHVLARSCESVVYSSRLLSETLEPDVALLFAPNPCFQIGQLLDVRYADQDQIYRNRGCDPRLSHRQNTRGKIEHVCAWAEYSERTHRFPHAMISTPYQVVLDIISWPPWRSNFSSGGDSGSWVISRDLSIWFGLLVGGDPYSGVSYAAVSTPLVDFLLAVSRNIKPIHEPSFKVNCMS